MKISFRSAISLFLWLDVWCIFLITANQIYCELLNKIGTLFWTVQQIHLKSQSISVQ